MSASFPGENLSLARSDSQGPPLSQHVTGIMHVSCQRYWTWPSPINSLFFKMLALEQGGRRFWTSCALCVNLLQQYTAETA